MRTIIFNLITLSLLLLVVSCNFNKNRSYSNNLTEISKSNDTIVLLRDLVLSTEKKIFKNSNYDDTKIIILEESGIAEPFMVFSNNIENDSTPLYYLKKMFFLDNSLQKIKFSEGNIDLFFLSNDSISFYDNILGDSSQWVFNHYRYHDIYYALFSYKKVNTIRIFNVTNFNDKTVTNNITFLPLSGDYEIRLPNGKMKKKWYREKTNYWDFFRGNILDIKSTFSNENEIKESIIDSIFR